MSAQRKPRKPATWGSIYEAHLRCGDDHGYAAYAADQWEARQRRKQGDGGTVV